MKLKANALNMIGALALSAGLTGTLAATPAEANVVSVTSSSTALDVALTVLGKPVTYGPLVPASGTAPPSYSSSNGVASFSATAGPVSLMTGVLSDSASGDTATGTGTATSSLAGFTLSVGSGPLTFLGLAASAISSTSSVDSTPSAIGSSTLVSATLSILGTTFNLPASPSPNDVFFSADGMTITLNEQTPDTLESAGITTDAIAITFTGFPVVSGRSLNIVNGSIDIGQSFASIDVSAIPEASTWAMMLLGFAGLGYAGFRKTRLAPSIV